jgi:GNAT superfamily N-acetyltransferase
VAARPTGVSDAALLEDALALRCVRLRPQNRDDEPFLTELYLSVRWPELEPSGWPDETKRAFLRDQFRLQSAHYAKAYYDAEFWIVEREGEALGRLYLFRGGVDHRIVDISLLPHARGKGLGGALLQAVQAEAAAAGKSVSIHVEKFNPAQTLYRRLGFHEIGDSGPYWLMEWRPES